MRSKLSLNLIFLEKYKPQMKAPRVTLLEGVSTYAPQGIRVVWESRTVRFRHDERRLITITHRKGHEERKAEEQESLRPLRFTEFHGIPTEQRSKATVVFQTGSTGYVLSFNQVHPVIMED
jgi:hypothetical protein